MLDELRDLGAREATGELICASDTSEVHIYLHRGRVAWATTSTAPFEFARYIRDNCSIDAETLRTVVEACRHERLPLGETLIQWGLVTLRDVENAVRRQVAGAISSLTGLTAPRHLFLRRPHFAQYNPALTLPLADVLPLGAPPAAPPLSDGERDDHGSADLLQRVEGARWVMVVRSGRVVEVAPHDVVAAAPEGVERAFATGAEVVAIRSPRGSLIGLRSSPETFLLCALETDAAFGGAVTRLTSLLEERTPPSPGSRPTPSDEDSDDEPIVFGERHRREAIEMRLMLGRASEILGAIMLDEHGRELSGACRMPMTRATCSALALRRRALLAPFEAEHAPSWMGMARRSVGTLESDGWCFGAELSGPGGPVVWLFTSRSAAQGLGWACLFALIRSLKALDQHTEVPQ